MAADIVEERVVSLVPRLPWNKAKRVGIVGTLIICWNKISDWCLIIVTY